MNKTDWGQVGERMAEDFLTSHGHQILDRNIRYQVGEIDLITLKRGHKEDTLHFIEVRVRKINGMQTPLESISKMKHRRFMKAVELYMNQNKKWSMGLHLQCSLDLLSIQTGLKRGYKLEFLEGALIL